MEYNLGDLLIAISRNDQANKNTCRVFLFVLSQMLADKSREGNNSKGLFFEKPGEIEKTLQISNDEYNNAANFLVEHGLMFKKINDDAAQIIWVLEDSSKWLLSELGPNITNASDKNDDIILEVHGFDSADEVSERIIELLNKK